MTARSPAESEERVTRIRGRRNHGGRIADLDVDFLLAEVDRLTAENAALRDQIQRVRALRDEWGDEAIPTYAVWAALDGDQPKPDSRCTGDAGTRPYWMSPDQYDPCRCTLPAGHEGLHQCEHSDQPKPSEQP